MNRHLKSTVRLDESDVYTLLVAPRKQSIHRIFSARFKSHYFDYFHFTLILTESAIFVLTWGVTQSIWFYTIRIQGAFLDAVFFLFLFKGNEGRKMSLMSRRLSNYIYYLKDSRSFRHQIMTTITTDYSA